MVRHICIRCMFHNKDSTNEFLVYLSSCRVHSNIEFDKDNAIPFLGILDTRNQNNIFMTSIYHKKTFTGLYTKWDSFTPWRYKINLICSLTYRCYRLCSSDSLLESALNDLRDRKTDTSRPSLKMTIPRPLLTTSIPLDILNIKWDHVGILSKGKTDNNCKIRDLIYLKT